MKRKDTKKTGGYVALTWGQKYDRADSFTKKSMCAKYLGMTYGQFTAKLNLGVLSLKEVSEEARLKLG